MRATRYVWTLVALLGMSGCGGGSGTAEVGSTGAAAGVGAAAAGAGAAVPNQGDATAPTAAASPQQGGGGAPVATGAGAGAGPGQGTGVAQGAGRPFTLSWQVPDRNEDGSPLATPPTFRIHYGRGSRDYQDTIELPERGASRHVFTSLEPGTWYLALTSVGPEGVESELSDEVVAQVN